MSLTDLKHLAVGSGADRRRVAWRRREGAGPPVVWLGGLRSDMTATKATALDGWAAAHGRAFLRFDYSGHGASDGAFAEGTVSRWLEDSLAVLAMLDGTPPVLVGSSLGGWLALLVARRRAETGAPPAAGLVLLAPAVDFTERLILPALGAAQRRALDADGVAMLPSAYGEDLPITRALIDDGRRHLLLGGAVRSHAPVHILQGMRDDEVPWRHATMLVEHLAGDPAVLTLIKDGDHRLSRPSDIERLLAAVAGITDDPSPRAPAG